MTASYEANVYCNQPEETLKEIMEDAVSQYLSSNPNALVIRNNDRSIVIKTSISTKSLVGERLKISLKEESFHIMSESIVSVALTAFGKNRDNVRAMSTYIENVIQGLS